MTRQYITPFGDYSIKRIPDNDKNLQAWNSADLYILKQLFEWLQSGRLNLEQSRILIINDAFGALAVPLSQFECDSYSDSFISHEATIQNIKANCPDNLKNLTLIKSTEDIDKKYDLVIFKEAKNQLFFKCEMSKLIGHLNPEALILGGMMAKNLQKNTLNMLNQLIGPAHASLTWKKSRLLFVEPEAEPEPVPVDAKNYRHGQDKCTTTFQLDDSKALIYNQANVFSRNKLDIGTRFFLQNFPDSKQYNNIIDLGCGNGVLSLKAAQLYPQASITCIDESYMAVASAKMTLEANLQTGHLNLQYIAANALSGYIETNVQEKTDLILCNPPFHQQYVVGDAIAWQMFKQSKSVLKEGGELWIVGNRHLGYHLKLKKIFGNQTLVATNDKFVIIKAVKM